MKRVLSLVVLLCAIPTVNGCTSGDDDDDDGGFLDILADPFGGVFVVFNDGASGQAFGSFFTAATPEPPPFGFAPEPDECLLDADSAEPEYEATWADLGEQITVSGGSTTITALRDSGFGISYGGFIETPMDQGIDYTIANSGSETFPADTLVRMRLPGIPVFTASPPLVAGEALDLEFNVTGADAVVLEVQSNGDLGYTCFVRDDGSFTIPAEVTAAVGSGGTYSLGGAASGRIVEIGDREAIFLFVSNE